MPKIELSRSGDMIVFDTTWVESTAVKQIPGVRWHPNERYWTAPLSYATCVIARGIFGDTLVVGDRINEWARNVIEARVKPSNALRLRTEVVDEWPFTGVSKTVSENLYGFQHVGVDFLIIAEDALLSDEQGTGKTIQALSMLRQLYFDGDDIFPVAVICPNGVKRNWATEAATWFPEATPIVISGTITQKAKLFAQAREEAYPLVIVNFEAARTHSRLAPFGSIHLKRCLQCDKQHGSPEVKITQCETHPRDLNTLNPGVVIVDEAHRIKDPKAKQTRAVWAIGHNPSVQRHIAMTGTPIGNAPDDLWSIMHFVHRDEYPTKSKWLDRYALMEWSNYGTLDIVGLNQEHREELYRYFDPRHRRMLKSVVAPQLPPKVRERRYLQMTPKQAKAYREMRTYLVTELEDGGIISTPSQLAKATRLLQFASAYATVDFLENGEDAVRLTEPSPKLDEFMQIIEDHGIDARGNGRALVATAMHKQLIMLASKRLEKANIKHGLITGGMYDWERDLALQDFQSGKTKVLLFTMAAGGTGLTMTAADTIVYLQRSWSMIDNLQSEDRVHRLGSERHEMINVIDLITEGTIEEHQIRRLYEKLARLEQINRDRDQLLAHGLPTTELDEQFALIAKGYV